MVINGRVVPVFVLQMIKVSDPNVHRLDIQNNYNVITIL